MNQCGDRILVAQTSSCDQRGFDPDWLRLFRFCLGGCHCLLSRARNRGRASDMPSIQFETRLLDLKAKPGDVRIDRTASRTLGQKQKCGEDYHHCRPFVRKA